MNDPATINREPLELTRNCQAFLIPSAAEVTLDKGTEVTIVQSLGSTYTVNIYGNLARIAGKDADALGLEVPVELTDDKALAEGTIEEQAWAQLRQVYDPEIPVNIVDLGLIYHCKVSPMPDSESDNDGYYVAIAMTLTAPGCGMGPIIAADARQRVLCIPNVKSADVDIVFDPPWDYGRMSDAAKLQLGVL